MGMVLAQIERQRSDRLAATQAQNSYRKSLLFKRAGLRANVRSVQSNRRGDAIKNVRQGQQQMFDDAAEMWSDLSGEIMALKAQIAMEVRELRMKSAQRARVAARMRQLRDGIAQAQRAAMAWELREQRNKARGEVLLDASENAASDLLRARSRISMNAQVRARRMAAAQG